MRPLPIAIGFIALMCLAASGPAAARLVEGDGGGSLRQLPGDSGCLSDSGKAGNTTYGNPPGRCGKSVGLARGVYAVSVSPDGGTVYATSSVAVVVFRREEPSGRLTQLPGPDGCLQDGTLNYGAQFRYPRCRKADVGAVGQVVVSSDGRYAYLAGGSLSGVSFGR